LYIGSQFNLVVRFFFGTSVAISGTNVVVGAPGENGNGNDGFAFIYDCSSLPCDLVDTLTSVDFAEDDDDDDEFGDAVAIDCTTVVVGAPRGDTADTRNDVGAAFVYDCNEDATANPTQSPTISPTRSPSASPTASPSQTPTISPTAAPTAAFINVCCLIDCCMENTTQSECETAGGNFTASVTGGCDGIKCNCTEPIIVTYAGGGTETTSDHHALEILFQTNLENAVAPPTSVCGLECNLYVSECKPENDVGNALVWRIEMETGRAFRFAGGNDPFSVPQAPFAPDGTPPLNVTIQCDGLDTGLEVDNEGNVYIAERLRDQILVVNVTTNEIYVFANTTEEPNRIAFDTNKEILYYTFDSGVGCIFPNKTEQIIADGFGATGDGGPAINATFANPKGVALDSSDNIYIADLRNHVIRRIFDSNWTIETFVGTIESSGNMDGSIGNGNALLNRPIGVAFDSSGNLYILESNGNKVRFVDFTTGDVVTAAGDGTSCSGSCGDGGDPLSAQFNFPRGIFVDEKDNVYVMDTNNNRVRKFNYCNESITKFPTTSPTISPSQSPSLSPSASPSQTPSTSPTASPTKIT